MLEVGEGLGSGPRLRYPLGYWNANGAMCGIAVAMLLWMSRSARWTRAALGSRSRRCRRSLLTLYFTYSRGGLLALVVGALCLLALSRDRLWMLATLAIGAIGALPALLAVPGPRQPRRQRRLPDIRRPGRHGAAHPARRDRRSRSASSPACGGWSARRRRRPGGRVELSRDPTRAEGGRASASASLAIAAAIAFGGRAWDQFSSSDIEFPTDPAQHFSDLSGAGRHDFWRVAIDAFEEKPLAGHGAGTYEFSWDKLRSIELPVHDAHSLYLEAFAELGLIGGLLVLGLVGGMLWSGSPPGGHAPRPQREAYAALFAAMLLFAVGVGFDWFWEIAGAGRGLLPRRRRAGRGSLRADRPGRARPRQRRAAASASRSAASPSPGSPRSP